MKKYLKISVILFLGVFLMAGTSFSTPYVDSEYAAYEYYQAVEGQGDVEYDASSGYAYDYWEYGTAAIFNFDLKNLGNNATNSALDMMNDVEGWGPGGITIADAFVSFTLFSIDPEPEAFDVTLECYIDGNPVYDILMSLIWIEASPLVTFTIPMVGDLLEAWQNSAEGLLTIDAFIENPLTLGYNDFGIVEAGIGVNPNPVPEPSTILLMGSGLLGLVGYNRKRFSKKS